MEKIITIKIKDLLKTKKERKHYRQFFKLLNKLGETK